MVPFAAHDPSAPHKDMVFDFQHCCLSFDVQHMVVKVVKLIGESVGDKSRVKDCTSVFVWLLTLELTRVVSYGDSCAIGPRQLGRTHALRTRPRICSC